MLLASRCQSQFPSVTRQRGQQYARSGAVTIQHVGLTYARASVGGSAETPYTVTLDWDDAREGILEATCECPHFADGYLCKHIWATLLTLDADPRRTQLPGRSSLQVYPGALDDDVFDDGDAFDDDEFDDELDEPYAARGGFWGEVFRPPAARRGGPAGRRGNGRFGGAQPVARTTADSWRQALRRVRQSSFSEDFPHVWEEVGASRRLAWYVLNVGQSVHREQIVIDLMQQQRTQHGQLGAIKRLSYGPTMLDEFEDAADRQLLPQLAACTDANDHRRGPYENCWNTFRQYSSFALPHAICGVLLSQLARTERLVWLLDSAQSWDDRQILRWDGERAWRLRLAIAADDTRRQWTITGELTRGRETRPLTEAVMVTSQGLVMFPDSLGLLAEGEGIVSAQWARWASECSPLVVPYAAREELLKQLWAAPDLPPVHWPGNLQLEEVRAAPAPLLRVRKELQRGRGRGQSDLRAEVFFQYGETVAQPGDRRAGILNVADADGPLKRVHIRDRAAERARLAELVAHPALKPGYGDRGDMLSLKQKSLPAVVESLLAAGWRVEAEGKRYRQPGDFQIEVKSGIDWFDLSAGFDFDGVQAQLPELLAAVRRGDKYVELGDGSRGLLPEQWLQRYAHLAELGESQDGTIRFQRSQALLLDALLEQQQNLRVDATFDRFRQRLHSVSGVTARDAPRGFRGTLRPYQREGLGWFRFLNELGLGGCLADDMGLGKTIQVLALLDARRTRRLKDGEHRLPSLVVVPKSLVFNWLDEAARFTPRLRLLNYTGSSRGELRAQFSDHHVIVTTYGTLRRDILPLKDQPFDYVILDEAQAIKNAGSQAAKCCLLLPATHRLALTGTPIENHLGELWSLFEFLNPGMLGQSRAFQSLCKSLDHDDQRSLGELAAAVAPFVLRRTKEQVLDELPDKTEQTVYCELTAKERRQYDQLRDFYRGKLAKVIDQKGLKQAKIHVLEALLRLRQAACHPGLIDKAKQDQPSAKIDTLLEQLQEVTGEQHKALVFSQFTSLLAIVRARLDKAGIRYAYLDGKTRNRKAVVQQFQQDDQCPVFLISLKAGGHGLNLTAADYVFILDPWWNPAVEMQAIDRAHRIGQTRRVFAYRLIAQDTVEEKVLQLQDSKRDLANAIITANDSLIRKLTADDLKLILS